MCCQRPPTERTGKNAGLFVASGVMVILDLDSHIFNYEAAKAAVIGGVQTRPIKTSAGPRTPFGKSSGVGRADRRPGPPEDR